MNKITKQNAFLKKIDSLKTSSTTIVSTIQLLTQAVPASGSILKNQVCLTILSDTQRNLKQRQPVTFRLGVSSVTSITQEAAAYSFIYHSDECHLD